VRPAALNLQPFIDKAGDGVVASAHGAFFLMNSLGQLDVKAPSVAALLIREQKFKYSFHIYDDTGKLRLTQPVSHAMQMNYDKAGHALIWILVVDNRTHAWSLEFFDLEAEKHFKMQLAVALLESARQEDFAKSVNKNDRDWVRDSMDAHEMETDEEEDKEMEDVLDEFVDLQIKPSRTSDFAGKKIIAQPAATATPLLIRPKPLADAMDNKHNDDDEDDEDAEGEEEDEEDGGETASPEGPRRSGYVTPAKNNNKSGPSRAATTSKKAKQSTLSPVDDDRNSNLAVGMSLNRTFVLRGSKIGVFKHDADDQLEFVNKIPTIQTLDGEAFQPERALLHERDSKMLLLHPDRQTSVFCMDLERGQVVEEWNVEDEAKIRAFAPTSKYAQLTGEKGVLGVNNNSVFSLDPRLNTANKLAQRYQYTKAPKMSCVAANGQGQVAVGDQRGEIRMFSDISKKAKTLLPGLGDAVVGIDVTEDGKYILATTSHYLLLIPTSLPSGQTGFDKAMVKAKPVPIKLQLDPKDLNKHNIGEVSFTAAHFNTGQSINEQWIVTSTGPFIITWSLHKVKHGKTKDYRIKRCDQDVVADSFRYDKEDQVVVTLPDDVILQRRNIQRPRPSAAAAALSTPQQSTKASQQQKSNTTRKG
jgi:hypothetical protein